MLCPPDDVAQAWAERNGRQVGDWYKRYSGGILSGGEDLARTLIRLEGGDVADAANTAGATIPMRNWSKNPLDVRQVIAALSSPDKSTFIHETGHLFLRQLMDEATYNPQIKQDMAVLGAWAGVSPEGWTREHHEKFARAFERWRQSGQAPNASLAGVFARFKGWLTDVYSRLVQTVGGKSALEQHPAFNPEVIGILSRYGGEGSVRAKTGVKANGPGHVGPVPGARQGWHGMGGISEVLPSRGGGGRLSNGTEPGEGLFGSSPSILAQQTLADAILFQRRMGDPKKVEGRTGDIKIDKSYLHDKSLSFQDRASYLEEIGLSYATPTLWEARQRMVDAGLQSAIVQARPQADRFAPRDIFYYEGKKLPVGSLFWDGEAGGADGEARFPVLTAGGQPSLHSLQGGLHYIYGLGNNIAAIASNANLVTKFYNQAIEAFYELQKKGINPERLPAIVYRVGRDYVSSNLEMQVALKENVDALLKNNPQINQGHVDSWAKEAFKNVHDADWGKPLFTRPIQTPATWADWQKMMPDLTFNIRSFITKELLKPKVSGGNLPTYPAMVNSMIDPRLVGVPNAYMAVGVVSVPRPVDPLTGKPLDLVKELSGLSKTGREARLAKIAHDMMMVAGNDQRTGLDLTSYNFRREPNISAHTTYTHALPSYFEGFLPVTHHQDLILGVRAEGMNDADRKTSVFEELPDAWYDYQFGTGR